MSDASVGHVIILLTTIIGIVVQVYRENRARRWQIEDRDVAAKSRAELHEKVDANTKISVEAFREANNVNQKIAQIGEANQVALQDAQQAVEQKIAENQTAVLDVRAALETMGGRMPPTPIRNSDLTSIIRQRSAEPESADRRRASTKVERRSTDDEAV